MFHPDNSVEDNRWIVESWAKGMEDAYYRDPKVIETEVEAGKRPRRQPEQIPTDPAEATMLHFGHFFDSIRTRKPYWEDAAAGHHAAACAHMVNRSARERRMVEWDFAQRRYSRLRRQRPGLKSRPKSALVRYRKRTCGGLRAHSEPLGARAEDDRVGLRQRRYSRLSAAAPGLKSAAEVGSSPLQETKIGNPESWSPFASKPRSTVIFITFAGRGLCKRNRSGRSALHLHAARHAYLFSRFTAFSMTVVAFIAIHAAISSLLPGRGPSRSAVIWSVGCWTRRAPRFRAQVSLLPTMPRT